MCEANLAQLERALLYNEVALTFLIKASPFKYAVHWRAITHVHLTRTMIEDLQRIFCFGQRPITFLEMNIRQSVQVYPYQVLVLWTLNSTVSIARFSVIQSCVARLDCDT